MTRAFMRVTLGKKKKRIAFFSLRGRGQLITSVLVVLLCVSAGAYLLQYSLAAGPAFSVEPEKGTASHGAVVVADSAASGGSAVKFNAAPQSTQSINDTSLTYSAGWLTSTGADKYQQDDHYSSTAGATATYQFDGSSIKVYGSKASHHGFMAVSIDGGSEAMVDTYAATRADQVLLYSSAGMSSGAHSVKIRVTDNKNTSSSGTTVTVDKLETSLNSSSDGTLLFRSDFTKGWNALKPEVENKNSDGISYPVVDGGNVLRFSTVDGTDLGYKYRTRFSHIGVAAQQEVRLKYDMFIPASANMSYHGKLPGLAGLPDSQGGWYSSSGGTMQSDSFGVRYHVRPIGHYSLTYPSIEAYIYAWHAGGQVYKEYGIQIPLTTDLSGSRTSGKVMGIPQGRWLTLETRVKLNTPGSSNGILEMWVDGVKGISLKDVQWRNSTSTTSVNQIQGDTFANMNVGRHGYNGTSYFLYRNVELRAP